jgi:D-alanine-D-alanine ligase-like ATP-grasp enzyme
MSSSFIADILRRIAPRIGARVVLEPLDERVGYLTFADGRRSYFRDNRFELNPLGSIRVAQDKQYCSYFLGSFGYQVPAELSFWNPCRFPRAIHQRGIVEALLFADSIGYPVFVKPNDKSQGLAVRKAYSPSELRRCAARALACSDVAIVQEACRGKDFRIVVLDGEVISAYERIPLMIIGDGLRNVRQLLTQRQRQFRSRGRDTTLRIDDEVRDCLKRRRMNLSSIPLPHQRVSLRDVANLSGGGESRDITSILHPDFARLACSVARDLCLRFCGIDLIATDATAPLKTYAILEVNSAPGLDHYALRSAAVQRQLVDSLYMRVLKAVERTPQPKCRIFNAFGNQATKNRKGPRR